MSKVVSNGKTIIEKYRQRNISYENAREELSKLLAETTKEFTHLNFVDLVKLGAPITINNGTTFTDAVRKWSEKVLNEISEERITYFMSDEERAKNLVTNIDSDDLKIIIDKDRKKLKSSYKHGLLSNDGTVFVLLNKIVFPLTTIEEIMDKIIGNDDLFSGSIQYIRHKALLEYLIRKDISYIKDKLNILVNDENNSGNVIAIMSILYRLNSKVYEEYVNKLNEESLDFFLENGSNVHGFTEMQGPIIKAYINLDKDSAIEALKKAMKKWDNIVGLLEFLESIDVSIRGEILDYILSTKEFNGRVVQYYLELVPGARRGGGWLSIDENKVLKTVTKASLLGNSELINKITKFFADDQEMLDMIKEASVIGG